MASNACVSSSTGGCRAYAERLVVEAKQGLARSVEAGVTICPTNTPGITIDLHGLPRALTHLTWDPYVPSHTVMTKGTFHHMFVPCLLCIQAGTECVVACDIEKRLVPLPSETPVKAPTAAAVSPANTICPPPWRVASANVATAWAAASLQHTDVN